VKLGGDYIVAPAPDADPAALMRGVTEIVGPESVVGTSQYVFGDGGSIPDGVHVGVPWYSGVSNAISADFEVAYEAAHGNKPTIDAAYGYTSVLLIARAVESACSNERADVIEELGGTLAAASVFGPFSLNKKGEPSHPMYLLKIENNTPTPP
jgi:ABC-type branched-subunit amino acid transport system substrate-binding protein